MPPQRGMEHAPTAPPEIACRCWAGAAAPTVHLAPLMDLRALVWMWQLERGSQILTPDPDPTDPRSAAFGSRILRPRIPDPAPTDRGSCVQVERMLRCGAQDLSLEDDTAFRKFSEAVRTMRSEPAGSEACGIRGLRNPNLRDPRPAGSEACGIRTCGIRGLRDPRPAGSEACGIRGLLPHTVGRIRS